MINLTHIIWVWFLTQGSLLDWMTAVGTISSSVAAVYFGAIRPSSQQARFKIHSPVKATSFSHHDYFLVGKEADLLEVGFLVEQISGARSRNVNILVKKIWYWDNGVGDRKEWVHFIPSNLSWASGEDPTFAKGVRRHCYFGVYGDPPENEYVGCVFNLMVAENSGDPFLGAFSSMLPSTNKYEVELMISGENVRVSEFKIRLALYNPTQLGVHGVDGLPVGGPLLDAVEIDIEHC